jgi:hypothetical protein
MFEKYLRHNVEGTITISIYPEIVAEEQRVEELHPENPGKRQKQE